MTPPRSLYPPSSRNLSASQFLCPLPNPETLFNAFDSFHLPSYPSFPFSASVPFPGSLLQFSALSRSPYSFKAAVSQSWAPWALSSSRAPTASPQLRRILHQSCFNCSYERLACPLPGSNLNNEMFARVVFQEFRVIFIKLELSWLKLNKATKPPSRQAKVFTL